MFRVKKKESLFYEMLHAFCGKILTAGKAFADLVNNFEEVDSKIAGMKVLETECDMEAHKILQKLHESSVTPFAREDIYSITKEMDDIVDSMEEVANRFLVFDIREVKPEAVVMADMVVQAIEELMMMFEHLPEMKKNSRVMDQIIEVNRIENEGDVVFRNALATLFREEKDPIELIKWKHLFEQIEESLDSCETVANIMEGVVMKYA